MAKVSVTPDELTIRALTAKTWDAFAELVERHNGAILIHLVQETARHNGHADIIREALDGMTGH